MCRGVRNIAPRANEIGSSRTGPKAKPLSLRSMSGKSWADRLALSGLPPRIGDVTPKSAGPRADKRHLG